MQRRLRCHLRRWPQAPLGRLGPSGHRSFGRSKSRRKRCQGHDAHRGKDTKPRAPTTSAPSARFRRGRLASSPEPAETPYPRLPSSNPPLPKPPGSACRQCRRPGQARTRTEPLSAKDASEEANDEDRRAWHSFRHVKRDSILLNDNVTSIFSFYPDMSFLCGQLFQAVSSASWGLSITLPRGRNRRRTKKMSPGRLMLRRQQKPVSDLKGHEVCSIPTCNSHLRPIRFGRDSIVGHAPAKRIRWSACSTSPESQWMFGLRQRPCIPAVGATARTAAKPPYIGAYLPASAGAFSLMLPAHEAAPDKSARCELCLTPTPPRRTP